MRPRAVLLALLVVCSLLAPAAGGATAPGVGGSTDTTATVAGGTLAQQSTESTPDTVMRVQVRPDGSADWNVTMFFTLPPNGDGFDDVARAFENGSADVGPSATVFEALAARGANATDRPMSVVDVERRGWHPGNGTGALTLTFTWTNFANTSGEGMVVGDAFGGAWEIDEGQRLAVYPPDGYSIQSFQPGTDRGVRNAVLRWDGPESFPDNHPQIEYSAGSEPGNGTGTPGGNGDGDSSGTDIATAVGATLALVVAIGAYLVYERRRDGAEKAGAVGVPTETENQRGTSTPSEGDDGTAEGPTEEPTEPDDEALLSDEERVVRLLEENDGRMKQANIVTETGWSNAKVSQLLSAMADDDEVEKLRIGRENLITLPEETDEE